MILSYHAVFSDNHFVRSNELKHRGACNKCLYMHADESVNGLEVEHAMIVFACANQSSRCDARDTFASKFCVHASRRLRNGHASHMICDRSTMRVKIDCTTTFHQAVRCDAARRKRRSWKDHRQCEGRREQLHVVEKDARPCTARRPRWSD